MKLPDQKWQKIGKKLPKNGENYPKMEIGLNVASTTKTKLCD